jgi:hypothetical protein
MTQLQRLDGAVQRRVGPGFRAGIESLECSDYLRDFDRPLDLEPLEAVLTEAMDRFSNKPPEADAWAAPRVHYALRLSRREAGDRDVWRFIGLVPAPRYVRWRWGKGNDPDAGVDDAAGLERFVGPDYKHAVGRLWWMAELFRNGPDYAQAVLAMTNQDIPNNLFRMDLAHHRPTVQAFVRTLSKEDGTLMGGREANALAKAVNAAAATLQYDAIAPDVVLDPEARRTWIATAGDVDPAAFFATMPDGPDDPTVPEASIERMVALFKVLFAEAPIRGRAA